MKNIFFKLCHFFYAAQTDSGIILLNAQSDKYISIAGALAVHLKSVLENPIVMQDGLFTSQMHADEQKSFDESVHYLLDQKIIEQCEFAQNRSSIKRAIEPGGLADYRWDTKEKLVAAHQASKLLTLKFLALVLQVDFILKRRGIAGIIKKLTHTKISILFIESLLKQR